MDCCYTMRTMRSHNTRDDTPGRPKLISWSPNDQHEYNVAVSSRFKVLEDVNLSTFNTELLKVASEMGIGRARRDIFDCSERSQDKPEELVALLAQRR